MLDDHNFKNLSYMNTIFQCDMNLVCYVQDAKLQQNHLVSLLLDFSTLLGNFQVLMDKIRHIYGY